MTRTGTLLLLTLAMACPASAHTVVIEGGKVHLRGELVNGGCAVAPDSQNMRIDMGQYRTNSFSGVGSFSTVNVPFTVRLLDCSVDVSRTVGIQFQGATPAEDPQVFLATSRPGETPVSSGVGLALCAQIAEAFGTQMTFASRVGEGTTVTILLQKEAEHEEAAQQQ